ILLSNENIKLEEIISELEKKLQKAHSTPFLKEFIIPSLEL
mgnify:CR=1